MRWVSWSTCDSRAPGNPVPLPVLAEQVTGDTKALLAGGSLASLVLRALAIRSGLESVPRDRAGQRALWEMHDAIPDDLASQVLVLNVTCDSLGLVSGWLNDASRFGVPFRLTLQQLVTGDIQPEPADIFVCENPAVLRVAAADLGRTARRWCAPRACPAPRATSCSVPPSRRVPDCTGEPISTGQDCVWSGPASLPTAPRRRG